MYPTLSMLTEPLVCSEVPGVATWVGWLFHNNAVSTLRTWILHQTTWLLWEKKL